MDFKTQIIGEKFHQKEEIGQGIFGKVYKGIDLKDNKIVAIKYIAKEKIQIKKKFKDDIEIMKKLDNSNSNVNIVKCFEHLAYYNENYEYIIQEFCDSGNYANYLYKNGPFTEKQAIRFMQNILEGFKEFIKYKIIPDLKPSDILINQNTYKLDSFLVVTKQQKEHKYMSPQILSTQYYTPQKSIVWSFGVILYETIFGQLPWTGRSIKEHLGNIINIPLQLQKEGIQCSTLMQNFLFYLLRPEESSIQTIYIFNLEERLSLEQMYKHTIFGEQQQIVSLLNIYCILAIISFLYSRVL